MAGFQKVTIITLWSVNANRCRIALEGNEFSGLRMRLGTQERPTDVLATCFSSRHTLDDTYTRNGELVAHSDVIDIKPAVEKGRKFHCLHCYRIFCHDPLGVPIEDQYRGPVLTVTMVDRSICSFECAISWILNLSPTSHIHVYRDTALRIIQVIFYLLYPEAQKLKRSQPFRLSDRVGGPLNDEQFTRDTYHTFHESPFVAVRRGQIEYRSKVIRT